MANHGTTPSYVHRGSLSPAGCTFQFRSRPGQAASKSCVQPPTAHALPVHSWPACQWPSSSYWSQTGTGLTPNPITCHQAEGPPACHPRAPHTRQARPPPLGASELKRRFTFTAATHDPGESGWGWSRPSSPVTPTPTTPIVSHAHFLPSFLPAIPWPTYIYTDAGWRTWDDGACWERWSAAAAPRSPSRQPVLEKHKRSAS